MRLYNFEMETATPVAGRPPQEERRVLAFLDWDHLPYELSRPGQGFRMWLLRGEDSGRAMSLLRKCQAPLDVLIVDEDFFGFPEDAADICLQIRRMYPEIHIVGIESEMSDSVPVLVSLGLCDRTLPAAPDAGAIAGALQALDTIRPLAAADGRQM
ncbi:MAG: hypothetical protein ACE369_00390 [Roseovarius sp.]